MVNPQLNDKMTVVVPPSKNEKAASKDAGPSDTEMEGTETVVDLRQKLRDDIRANYELLERAVFHFDPRFTLRALRSISTFRKQLDLEILEELYGELSKSSEPSRLLPNYLSPRPASTNGQVNGQKMEIDTPSKQTNKSSATPREILPEIELYVRLLKLVYHFDQKQWKSGAEYSKSLIDDLRQHNRRTLDPLVAKIYYYTMLFVEHLEPLPPSPMSPSVSLRPVLLAALRTAVLRKDTETHASVTTLLLRNYLATSHVTQADLLISNAPFPEAATNAQWARYYYYLGRIRAIQLAYSDAHANLVSATRKSPSSKNASGFYQAAMKLQLVVELLMGDIPDRATFREPSLELTLKPYLHLVQAVRVGALENFTAVVAQHSETFRRDNTLTLIQRLRQNVIRTGIRMISLSYAKISLRDICVKLGLRSEETAEYIVAKAIRDGVIEATLDHEHGYMKSKETGDVYTTGEPGEAFNLRIQACLNLHDESVRAMRFPMNQHRLELKNAQEARDRERELAKEIADGDLSDDGGPDFDGPL